MLRTHVLLISCFMCVAVCTAIDEENEECMYCRQSPKFVIHSICAEANIKCVDFMQGYYDGHIDPEHHCSKCCDWLRESPRNFAVSCDPVLGYTGLPSVTPSPSPTPSPQMFRDEDEDGDGKGKGKGKGKKKKKKRARVMPSPVPSPLPLVPESEPSVSSLWGRFMAKTDKTLGEMPFNGGLATNSRRVAEAARRTQLRKKETKIFQKDEPLKPILDNYKGTKHIMHKPRIKRMVEGVVVPRVQTKLPDGGDSIASASTKGKGKAGKGSVPFIPELHTLLTKNKLEAYLSGKDDGGVGETGELTQILDAINGAADSVQSSINGLISGDSDEGQKEVGGQEPATDSTLVPDLLRASGETVAGVPDITTGVMGIGG